VEVRFRGKAETICSLARGVSDYSLRPIHTEVPTFQGNVRNSVKPDLR